MYLSTNNSLTTESTEGSGERCKIETLQNHSEVPLKTAPTVDALYEQYRHQCL